MISLQEEILKKLNDSLLKQTVVINTLCDILVQSEIISEKKLVKLIDRNIRDVENQLKKMEEQEQEDLELYKKLSLFKGPRGEA